MVMGAGGREPCILTMGFGAVDESSLEASLSLYGDEQIWRRPGFSGSC